MEYLSCTGGDQQSGLPIWRRKALQGPDGMDDEATRIALTHLIVQGIYYLQILGSKLVVLREGDISGLASSTAISAGLQFRPGVMCGIIDSLPNSCTELASFRLPLLPWREL